MRNLPVTKRKVSKHVHQMKQRRGAASMDYVLVLAVILPLLLFLFTVVPRMIQLVYEMTVVIVGSPIM